MKMLSFKMSVTLFVGILFSTLVLAGSSEQDFMKMLSKEDGCRVQLMKKMGWTLNFYESSSKSHFDVEGGRSCTRANWVEVMHRKDLQVNITFPRDKKYFNNQFFTQSLNDAMNSKDSLCAYKHRYHEALKLGTKKVIANTHAKGLRFGTPKNKGLFCDLPPQYWRGTTFIRNHSKGYCFVPRGSNSSALACFYQNRGQVECAVGIQLATLVALNELYGSDVDKCFSKDEICVGTWTQIHHSNHPVFSGNIKRTNAEYPKSWWGVQNYIGLTGYIGSALKDESLLDSSVDRGENFIIVDTTENAIRDLQGKGLSYFSKNAYKAWELTRTYYKKKSRGTSKSKLSKILRERDALINSPFLKDTIVYVHPLGYMSLTRHIYRLLNINPRMPYRLLFYQDTSNKYQFKRYKDFYMETCLKK